MNDISQVTSEFVLSPKSNSDQDSPVDSSQETETVPQLGIDRKPDDTTGVGEFGWPTRCIPNPIEALSGARIRPFGKCRGPGGSALPHGRVEPQPTGVVQLRAPGQPTEHRLPKQCLDQVTNVVAAPRAPAAGRRNA